MNLSDQQQLIETELEALEIPAEPKNLYEPIRYFLGLGGKRMRPVLSLLASDLFEPNCQFVMGPALGVEIFHNFTLIHDDIMDEAPLRRGKPTVHSKWNRDVAILSGDTLFVIALRQIMRTRPEVLTQSLDVFLNTAAEVCEGQQHDMDFQLRESVSVAEYLEMIRLKTAVLVGCSLQLGALAAGASVEDARACYEFGQDLGVAFQLKDDLLDAYGDPEKFGKQPGGDILSAKKTYLLIATLSAAGPEHRNALLRTLHDTTIDPDARVSTALEAFGRYDAKSKTESEISYWYNKAMLALNRIQVSDEKKTPLRELAEFLLEREQ